MSFFFSVLSFFFKMCVRERVYKIGYKEKQSQSLLIFFFSTEFLWRIFPLLRANRLYAIFSTGLKIRLLLVRDFFSSSFTRSTWLLVPSATNPDQQLTFFFSISTDGKESPLPFWGPSQSFGFYLLPSRVRQPEGGHRVQTSVLNGHSLMACYC